MDFTELKRGSLLADSHTRTSIKGFYPAIFDRDIDPVVFYANYIQTYIEKDVTELMNIRDLKLFSDIPGLVCGTCGATVKFRCFSE